MEITLNFVFRFTGIKIKYNTYQEQTKIYTKSFSFFFFFAENVKYSYNVRCSLNHLGGAVKVWST